MFNGCVILVVLVIVTIVIKLDIILHFYFRWEQESCWRPSNPFLCIWYVSHNFALFINIVLFMIRIILALWRQEIYWGVLRWGKLFCQVALCSTIISSHLALTEVIVLLFRLLILLNWRLGWVNVSLTVVAGWFGPLVENCHQSPVTPLLAIFVCCLRRRTSYSVHIVSIIYHL